MSSIVTKRWLRSALFQLNIWSLISHPVSPWWVLVCHYLDLVTINSLQVLWALLLSPNHTLRVIRCAPLDWLLLFGISNSLCRPLLALNGRHPFCRLTEAGKIIHGRLQRVHDKKFMRMCLCWKLSNEYLIDILISELHCLHRLLLDFSCQQKVNTRTHTEDLEVKCWARVQLVWGGNKCLSFFISSSVTGKVLCKVHSNKSAFFSLSQEPSNDPAFKSDRYWGSA